LVEASTRLPRRLRKQGPISQVGASLVGMGKRESQQVAYAVVELRDARDELAASTGDFSSVIAQLDKVVARLDDEALATPGLPVSEAAAYLQLSEPTVRDWLKRGALKSVPGAKPVLVERESLRSVRRAVDELRERGKDTDWLRSLLDYLDDLAVVRSPEVQRGLADIAAGKLEPA
jgi:excisionase family DNA binding protein